MPEPEIIAHRITKPIQLLAAWLAGLSIINGSFLAGAAMIKEPNWIPGLLVIAAVSNVPLFLISLFLLQTKFRPQMQEDSYYSKYLENTYSNTPLPAPPIDIEKPLRDLAGKIVAEITKQHDKSEIAQEDKVLDILKDSEIDYLTDRFKNSRALSELFTFPNLWKELIESWCDSKAFQKDIDALIGAGLVVVPDKKQDQAKLTSLGNAVANKLQIKNELWNQNNERHLKMGKEIKG